MHNEFTAVVKKIDAWWIGWISEIPGINCQENSFEELMISLKSALAETLEMNRMESLKAAGDKYTEHKIAI